MRIGDRIPVQIEGVSVAEARVEDIEDGTATLVIDATRLVVKLRQSLDLAATNEPEVDRVFVGVQSDQDNTSEATEALSEAVSNSSGTTLDVGEGIHGRQLDSSAID